MSGKRAAKRSPAASVFWFAALGLLAVQLLVTAVLAVDQYTGHEAVAISGGSMEPEFSRGDIVWLDTDAVAGPGDIITFRAPSGDGTVITHRVLSEGGGAYRTKGDANGFEDFSSVPTGNVIGVVQGHTANLGYLVLTLVSPWGRLVTYGPILLLILVSEVLGLRSGSRGRRSKDTAPAPA